MNAGGHKGGAHGFKITSINKLVDSKSSKGGDRTLLHFTAGVVTERMPELEGFTDELELAAAASRGASPSFHRHYCSVLTLVLSSSLSRPESRPSATRRAPNVAGAARYEPQALCRPRRQSRRCIRSSDGAVRQEGTRAARPPRRSDYVDGRSVRGGSQVLLREPEGHCVYAGLLWCLQDIRYVVSSAFTFPFIACVQSDDVPLCRKLAPTMPSLLIALPRLLAPLYVLHSISCDYVLIQCIGRL